jgi:hypothetical protein
MLLMRSASMVHSVKTRIIAAWTAGAGIGESLRAARANHVQFARIHRSCKLNAVLGKAGRWAEVPTNFAIRKSVYPKIVDCARMDSSSVRKRRSTRTDSSSVMHLSKTLRAARANRVQIFRIDTIRKI